MVLKSVFAPHLNGRVILGGRRRPRVVGPHLKLRNYLGPSVPSPPASVDYSPKALPVLRDILGNDQLGDCVIAEGYHGVALATGNAGNLFTPTLAQIIADYSAIGGYNPADPSTDQGCDELTALNYWVQTGFADGTRLSGYLAVNPASVIEIQTALWLFENLILCLELPDSYINPFPSIDGFVWDTGVPDPNNGHCIGGVGFDGNGVTIDTWGLFGSFTYAGIASLCDGAQGGSLYVWLTPDQIAKGQDRAPNGFAWADLIYDFDALGGNVPAPAPSPAPAPTNGPTLADAQAWAAQGLADRWPQ